jgi:glycosyltransferase involved in cell wall biosynthesis
MLIVTRDFWSDHGAANAAREVAKGLARLGVELITIIHEDSVITSDGPTPTIAPKAIQAANASIMQIPQLANYIRSRRAARILRSMQEELGDDCIVHCHNLFPFAFFRNELRKSGAKFVTTIHGTIRGELERLCRERPLHPRELLYRLGAYGQDLQWSGRFLKRGESHFIALSVFDACEFMRQSIPSSRIHVIRNGVDLEMFKPYDSKEARKQLNLPADKPLVVTVGAVIPRKGIHLLIKAANKIVRNVPQANFVVVGKPELHGAWYVSYLEKLLTKFDLKGHFRFTGFVAKNDLPLYLSAADLFTLASYAEGAPLVVPSAMACGCPIVATETAAACYLPQYLTVANGDYDELGRKISFYLLNSKERRSVGREMRKKALEELSWTKIASKTYDLYKKIIS